MLSVISYFQLNITVKMSCDFIETIFQNFAALLHISIYLFLPVVGTLISAYGIIYGNLLWKTIILAYLIYIYYDNKYNFSSFPGNGWKICRSNCVYRRLRAYFPIDLVKTAELPADKNYVIACFPHGVLGFSIVTNMLADIDKWITLFPGVRSKAGTLNFNFSIPIWREVQRMWGLHPVSKETILHFLSKSNDPRHPENADGFTSNAVAIVVGGAHEALDARPGNYDITLKKRKGFIKVAIKTGAAIVPSFSFGEVDIYDQVKNPPGSLIRSCQIFLKNVTGLAPVLMQGRGRTILPFRKPITQVLGAPIIVNKYEDPPIEYVNEIHQKFVEAIMELFETHKYKYIENAANKKLVIN